MSTTVVIDPVTRIEGHLSVGVDVENGVVTSARCAGEMFRGMEVLLRGRHPMDAHQITQRICGVCPISHALASVFAQEMAYGIAPPRNGRLMRNLIQGANYIQSHILHFYHLSALDFVDIAAILQYEGDDAALKGLKQWVQSQQASGVLYPGAPFLPRYEGQYLPDAGANITAVKHYLEALDMRAMAHQAAATFAGKMPHAVTIVPGGVTEVVTADKVAAYAGLLNRLRAFIDTCYLPDVVAVAGAFPEYFDLGRGYTNYLSFGVFPETEDGLQRYFPSGALTNGALSELDPAAITEDVGSSWFSSATGLSPDRGETRAQPDKAGAYSWLKAPRYKGQPMEVGPLARMLVAYQKGHPEVKGAVDGLLTALGLPAEKLNSVMGRHAARALECKIVADRCAAWLDELKPEQPSFNDFNLPASAKGYGLTEAPRGALGHWIGIADGKISNYQCVVPTTWNCSPRDDKGVPGPVEQALVGTPIANPAHPVEAARIVRAFDPCIACAVH